MPFTSKEHAQLIAESNATADLLIKMPLKEQDEVLAGCHPYIGTYTEINSDGSKGSTHYLPDTVVNNSTFKGSLMREACHKELL